MDHQLAIQDNGFTILKDVFDQPTIERLLASTAAGLSAGTTENIKTSLRNWQRCGVVIGWSIYCKRL